LRGFGFAVFLLFAIFATNNSVCVASAVEAVSVTLPSEIPFKIVLPKNGGEGYIDSQKFWITNNGAVGVEILLDNAWVNIENKEDFSVSDEETLPNLGNSMHLKLICEQSNASGGALSSDYVLTGTPRTTHAYWLESGESASFRIGGLASERGETRWAETTVTVSVCFGIAAAFEVPEAEETVAEPDAEMPEVVESEIVTPEVPEPGVEESETDGDAENDPASGPEAMDAGDSDSDDTDSDVRPTASTETDSEQFPIAETDSEPLPTAETETGHGSSPGDE
jgi:hypothetical protein